MSTWWWWYCDIWTFELRLPIKDKRGWMSEKQKEAGRMRQWFNYASFHGFKVLVSIVTPWIAGCLFQSREGFAQCEMHSPALIFLSLADFSQKYMKCFCHLVFFEWVCILVFLWFSLFLCVEMWIIWNGSSLYRLASHCIKIKGLWTQDNYLMNWMILPIQDFKIL